MHENKILRIIKAASCPSLSGKSILTYQLGVDTESALFIRIARNSARGYFNKLWVRFSDIEEIWADRQTVNSLTLQSVGANSNLTTWGCGRKLGLIKRRLPGFGDARQGCEHQVRL